MGFLFFSVFTCVDRRPIRSQRRLWQKKTIVKNDLADFMVCTSHPTPHDGQFKPRAVHLQYIHGSERLTFSSTSVPEMRIDRLLSAPTLDELQGILQQVQTGPSQEGWVSA